ncbi:MAG TPA: hypothetical protein VG097_01965 [Gemmata sp.]|jgi:hypothetical protein|nr:hypothetical protein [Gemmata sp.]
MSSETRFKLGDRVKLINSTLYGRIVELRGPLAPNRVQVYSVLLKKKPFLKRKPDPSYVEVREDQLELLPKKGDTSKVESTELTEEKSVPPDNHN